MVLMLEPLHACNLTCTGCGRIREYKSTINETLTVEQCLAAVDDCGAPIVSICGGEPMIYPEIGQLAGEILERGKHIILCTNGMFIRKRLHEFRPTSSFFWNVHLDGMERTHDLCVERDGVFREAVEGIKAAKAAGFLVCSNTTIYKETDLDEIAELYEYLDTLGVDGYMLSPAYSYAAVMTKDIFMSREDVRDKFRKALALLDKYNLMVSPIYLDFLRGDRELDCTAWGTPTFNPRGWKGPCYLITDDHYDSYKELIDKTPWEKYGPGNDPRCADCMMHVGFEPSPVLGAKRQFGDTWKMLKWQFSGRMGGNPERRSSNGGDFGAGSGHAHAAAAPKMSFRRTEDYGCYDHAGHRSERIPGQPRGAAADRARRTGARAAAADEPGEIDRWLAGRARGRRSARSLAHWTERCQAFARVYHVAADYRLWARDPREIYESNVAGHAESARCRAAARRLTSSSTPARWEPWLCRASGALPDERTDSSVGEMIGDYKRSKWLAEQEAKRAAAAGLPVVIVNPTTPVGPGDAKPTPTGRIIVDFLNGRMPAYVDAGLNFVPVEDAAAGHLLAAERGRVGERYILGGENLTLKQVLGDSFPRVGPACAARARCRMWWPWRRGMEMRRSRVCSGASRGFRSRACAWRGTACL